MTKDESWVEWLVQTNDSKQLYLLAGFITLVHALKKGGRWPYFWLGTVLHGIYADNFWHFVLPEFDNFWHSQTSINPGIMYHAADAVSKLKLPRYIEPFAVGLVAVLINLPYDIVAVKFVQWTWHDTDPNIFDRHYWVPWNSYYFHAAFTTSFFYIFSASRRWFAPMVAQWESAGMKIECKSLAIATLLGMPGGVLLFVPIYHTLHDVCQIYTEVTFFLLFNIYAAFVIQGLLSKRNKSETKLTTIDYILMAQLALHYIIYWLFVVFLNPENEVSVGLHEPIGPCNEMASLTTPFGQWVEWLVQTNDSKQLWNAQPTYIISQGVYLLAGFITLVHALKKGGRWPYFWLGTVLHGIYADNFWHFVLPEFDNFLHSQTLIIFLGCRLPLHIIFVYPAIMYHAAYAVSKLKLPRYIEPFAVGLVAVLIDLPYDIVAVKFVHWTWHDTDPNIFDRHYWVPWNSYYFHAAFTASFFYIFSASRRWFAPMVAQWESAGMKIECKSLAIATLLGMPGGVLLFVPIYHTLHDVCQIYTEVTFFLLFNIYAAFVIQGLLSKRNKSETKLTTIDYILMAQLALHYIIYWLFVVFLNPENEVSVGLHEPIGPCNEMASLTTPFGQWVEWLVQTNDSKQLWNAQPTYIISQGVYLLAGFITLVHALKKGGRWPYFWLGTVLHGIYADNFWHFVLPEFDNFWHSQTSIIFLGGRLPLHIIFVYPAFMYHAAYAVSKLKLPRYAEPFAVGLVAVLIDLPYDIVAVKFVHWTWHDTDPNIFDRHYWVPWNSYYFHAAFTASFFYIFSASRRWFAPMVAQWESAGKKIECKSLAIATLLGMPGGVLLFVPIYHPLHDVCRIHTEVTFFLLFTIYAAFIIQGLLSKRNKSETKLTTIDYILMAQLALHYIIYWLFVVFLNPENEVSVGLHEPIGPCNEMASLTTPFGQTLSKRKYFCPSNYDEGYFDFHCVNEIPQNGTWYTICGTPFENRAEYIMLISAAVVLAASVFHGLYFKTYRAVKTTQKYKLE